MQEALQLPEGRGTEQARTGCSQRGQHFSVGYFKGHVVHLESEEEINMRNLLMLISFGLTTSKYVLRK